MSDKPLDSIGIDPAGSEVGNHDFVAINETSIQRFEAKRAAIFEAELAAVTRERDALKEILQRLVEAKIEKDTCGDTARYRRLKIGAWEAAQDTLTRLASGELRKPSPATSPAA